MERHHAEHIVPVLSALPSASRGALYLPSSVASALDARGIEVVSGDPLPGPEPLLVSASGSMQRAAKLGRTNVAIMEHGAGQSFGGDRGYNGVIASENPSYAGGAGRTAGLFIHPGEHPAARDRARYPLARVEVVGCPKLDSLPRRVQDGVPTVAFSFHWDSGVAPEAGSSFIFYREQLARFVVANPDIRVLGHGHPRIIERLAVWYERKGIEVVQDFNEVCRRADVYACDGMSTLYEFASTDRPVVVLNHPSFRRHVEHGLRFWSAANVGENVWEPYDITAAVQRALSDPDATRDAREDALDQVYAYRTGAAQRAADALVSWADGLL